MYIHLTVLRYFGLVLFLFATSSGYALDRTAEEVRPGTAPAEATSNQNPQKQVKGWPAEVVAIEYRSDADDTQQPALFYQAASAEPAPLVVALHSWSSNYRSGNDGPKYARWCIQKQWHFIHPNFRGPNVRPEATGSDLVIADVLSAVQYAKRQADIDASRIYLLGASGGGYTSLLVAGRAPQPWAAVSAWVPITDLTAWHAQTKAAGRGYYKQIEASCGGPPGQSPAVDREYRQRSPLTHLTGAGKLPLDINAGINDGHSGSVPISHSLEAFNVLAQPADQLADETMKQLVEQRNVPESQKFNEQDDSYGDKPVLFRRQSDNVRVTIFDGGHEIVVDAAMQWLSQHHK